MNKLISFFDYIFFRAYVHFQKKDAPIAYSRAVDFTVLVQCLLLLDVLLLGDYIFKFISAMDKRYVNKYLWALPPLIILWILNYYRYGRIRKKDNFLSFYARWGGEDARRRKVKGWLIALSPVFAILGLPVILFFISKFVLK